MNQDWVLLGNARSSILRMWNICSAILMIFFTIQQTTGVISGVQKEVWFWFFICMFPCLTLLNINVWLRRRTDKIISPTIYRSLYFSVIIYLLLVILTVVLSRAAIDMNDYGLDVYYYKSLWILSPFNLLLIIGLGLVFYQRESIFKPSPAAILKLANTKAKIARKNNLNFKTHCYDALREDKISEVFQLLYNHFQNHNKDSLNMLILLQNRYNNIIQAMNLNTITLSESQIGLNKITVGLIDIIDTLNT